MLSARHGQRGTDTHLDVGVHIHEGPLAVLTVDAEGQLHLFVQQNTHFDSLFLQRKVERERKKKTTVGSDETT